MNFEALLLSTLKLYKVSNEKMDVLQSIFLKSLPFVLAPMFLSYVLEIGKSDYALLSPIFFLASFVFALPFITAVIRMALKKDMPTPYFGTIFSKSFNKTLFIIVSMVALGALSLLPYFTVNMLTRTPYGTLLFSTNIAFAYIYVVFGFAVVVTTFAGVKFLTALVSLESKNPDNLGEIFRKTGGHFFALMLVVLAGVLPAEAATQLILAALSGLHNIMDVTALHVAVYFVSAFVRAIGFLLELYVVWMGITLYMKKEKLVE